MARLYYPGVSDEDWPPPEARARAALWAAERHLTRGEYVAAASALDGAVVSGDPEYSRCRPWPASAGDCRLPAPDRRSRRARGTSRWHATRLSPFLPVFEEVDLEELLEVVAASLET